MQSPCEHRLVFLFVAFQYICWFVNMMALQIDFQAVHEKNVVQGIWITLLIRTIIRVLYTVEELLYLSRTAFPTCLQYVLSTLFLSLCLASILMELFCSAEESTIGQDQYVGLWYVSLVDGFLGVFCWYYHGQVWEYWNNYFDAVDQPLLPIQSLTHTQPPPFAQPLVSIRQV